MQDKRVSPESSIKEQAEHYRLCLALSFVTVAEVVAWADIVILNSRDVSPQIIDLALAGNRHLGDFMDCLAAVQGNCDYVAVATCVLQKLNERHQNNDDVENAIKDMRTFFNNVKLPRYDCGICNLFETDLWMLEEGCGSLGDIIQKIIDHLAKWRENVRSFTSSPTPPSSSPPGRAC